MLDLWLQGSGQWLGNQRSRCPMGAPSEQGHLCLNWPQRAVWSPSQTDTSPRLVKHVVRTVPAPREVFSLPLQKDTCCMWCELHPNSPSISFGPLGRNFKEASSWLFFFFFLIILRPFGDWGSEANTCHMSSHSSPHLWQASFITSHGIFLCWPQMKPQNSSQPHH